MVHSLLSPDGFLHRLSNNFAMRIAAVTFDTAGVDSSGVSNKTAAAHGTGIKLPAHAIVCGGFMDVNTAFTGSGASVAVHIESANDIQTAAAISGAPWSTIGLKAIVPKANTPESTAIKLTAERELTVTVSAAALTAGKVTIYLYYLTGIASA